MSQSVRSSKSDSGVRITLNGRFDFAVHDEFRSAYEELVEPGAAVVIDMRGVEYMDGSALGMLLLLRDHAGEEASNIQIDHCNADVRNILHISDFEKLFKIN